MKSDRFPLTRRLLKGVMRHWRVFFAMLLCMVGAGALQPTLPWLLAPLLDAAVENKSYPIPAHLLPYAMLGVILLLGVFTYGRSYLGGWLDATLQRDYRAQMTRHLLRLPLAHLRRDSTGLLTSRFMAFLPQMSGAVMPVCMALVQETIRALGYIGLMLYWQWQLTLIVLLAAPIGAGLIAYLGRRMKRVAKRAQTESAAAQSRLNEIIATVPAVKLSGEAAASRRLGRVFNALRGSVIRTHIVLSAGQPLTHMLIAVPFAVVLSAVVGALADGDMSAGEAAAFLTVMLLLPTPVRVIARSMQTWEQMLVASREVFGFLDAATEPDHGKKTLHRPRGDITFENITFAYQPDQPPVLQDFSLHVQSGETVALVGRSGAGKTTLCNLLPRYYNAAAGAVKIDQRDIRDYTLDSLRANIAMVPQKPLLFDDTVAMNVAFPEEPDDARVQAALTAAAAEDFVQALPDGANTRIGENGERLSGGQQQRLMLARAFYRDAPIVLLDEATSAQDSETEGKIKTAMRRLLKGRTALVIAHRFSTITFAHRIAVLDGGKLQAIAPAEQLRHTSPLFAEWYKSQQL